MKEGDKIRIKSGKHEGRTGELIGPIPMSQVQDLAPGQEISMEGAKLLWAIQLDEGDEQTVLEETELEIIED